MSTVASPPRPHPGPQGRAVHTYLVTLHNYRPAGAPGPRAVTTPFRHEREATAYAEAQVRAKTCQMATLVTPDGARLTCTRAGWR